MDFESYNFGLQQYASKIAQSYQKAIRHRFEDLNGDPACLMDFRFKYYLFIFIQNFARDVMVMFFNEKNSQTKRNS